MKISRLLILVVCLLGTSVYAQNSGRIQAEDYLLTLDLANRAQARSILVDAERILVDNPGDPVALQHQGVAYMVLGRLGEAVYSLEEAVAQGAGSPALLSLGEALMRQGKLPAAALNFSEVTAEEGPFTARGHFLYGLVMDKGGKTKKAIAAYVEALRRDPSLRLEPHNPHVVKAHSLDFALVRVLNEGGESVLTEPMTRTDSPAVSGTKERAPQSGRILNPWKRKRRSMRNNAERTTPNQKAIPAQESKGQSEEEVPESAAEGKDAKESSDPIVEPAPKDQ